MGTNDPFFQDPPTPEQKLFLVQVREIFREELENYEHPCRFANVKDEDTQQLGHLLGAVADLSEGSLSQGIAAVRDNQKWLQAARNFQSRLANSAATFVIITFIGGVVGAVWLGVKQLVGK